MRTFWHLFFIFFTSSQAYLTSFALFFMCMFVSSAGLLLALVVQMNLRLPIYCSALGTTGQEHPSILMSTVGLGGSREETRSSIPSIPSRVAALWKHSGPAGTERAIPGSVTILPPSSVPLVYAPLLVCPPLPSLLSVRRVFSFNRQTLPAHDKAPSGLSLSMPELVSVRLLSFIAKCPALCL